MTPTLYAQLEIPESDRATSIRPDAAMYLHSFIREHGLSRTLEIGLAYGCSAAHIMTATTSRHIAIDPFQHSYGNDLGLRNLERLGLAHRLELRRELSRQALPRLADSGDRFDLIFVDGGHRFDEVFTDFALCDPLLLEGGYIVFDDAWMASVQHVAALIRTNRADYQEVPSQHWNMVIFRRIGSDERSWDHFEEFCRDADIHLQGLASRWR